MKKRFLALFLMCMIIISHGIMASGSPTEATGLNSSIKETPSGIPIIQIEQKVDQHIQKYIGKTSPGIAIAVVKDGDILFSKGYGFADIEKQVPVDASKTVFEWGSISKLFTWTSVMQLVEQGKIDLDLDIKTYLPDEFVKQLHYEDMITMRDLMNHAAGFGDYAFSTIGVDSKQVIPEEKALIRNQPKQYYKVGTASAYSNYGTGLAGYIVESITKQSYADYQRENVFTKLGMTNTSAHTTAEDNKGILKTKAQGYIPDGKGGFENGGWSYCSLASTGSIDGTVEDLARFAIALTEDSSDYPLFIHEDTLSDMLSPSYKTNDEMIGTSHGFFEFSGEYPTFGHGGNTVAFSSTFAVVPEDKFGICILSNAKNEMTILYELQDLLIGKKNKEIVVPNTALPSSKEVEGSYVPIDRQEGNFLDFVKYISLYKVKASKDNEITLSYGSYQGVYNQTKPYHYELKEYNSPMFNYVYPFLEFKMVENKPQQIMVGKGMDLSILPNGRTTPILISSIIILAASSIFFLVGPFLILILAVKGRNQELTLPTKRFNRCHSFLILLGAVTLLNNYVCVFRIMTNLYLPFTALKPHILLNYPLIVATIIMAIYSSILSKITIISKIRKTMYIISLILLVGLFSVLILWNFFSIVG